MSNEGRANIDAGISQGRHNYQRMYASCSVCSQAKGNLIPQPGQSRLIKLHLKVLFKKAMLA